MQQRSWRLALRGRSCLHILHKSWGRVKNKCRSSILSNARNRPGAGDVALRIARPLPSVIDVHVNIARLLHPTGNHGISDATNYRIIDLVGKFGPTVPAHRRRSRQPVVRDIMQLGQRQARWRQCRFRFGALGHSFKGISSGGLRQRVTTCETFGSTRISHALSRLRFRYLDMVLSSIELGSNRS